ncbi:MAG: alkaline phosphatase family protein [Burkholderiales bacterium]|nr:alkaline phosphatase family protein [Burkholderiales bacterium]
MPVPLLLRPLFPLAAAAALLAGCAAVAPGAPAERPRLLVLLVVDGVAQAQLAAYRDQYGPDGFNRFLNRGAWFAEAHYGHAYTVTAAGHATILTGATPRRSGIIGNEWRDPASGRLVYCAGDPAHRILGHAAVPLAGTSPANLRVESLGDVLRAADPRSKVIAVSGKDRGAILPAGRAGTAYMYQAQTGRFASSTYYMQAHPAWVEAFNAAKPADRQFGARWEPLLPAMAYARSAPDGGPGVGPGGSLPKVMGAGRDGPGPLFYESLLASPFADALVLDFARAAIAGEALGKDDAPDILSVSLSAHDYVNHNWGPQSRISHDHLLQLDELLAAFLRDLDRAVGRDRYLAVVTADHGFDSIPEQERARGRDAGRRRPGETLAVLEAGLAKRFGPGPWVRGWSAHGIVLERARAGERGIEGRELDGEAVRVLREDPAVAAAFARAELEDDGPTAVPYLDAARKTWHPALSADVQVIPKPGWQFTSYPTGTTHGSPHPYDTHVPLLFFGPKWVKAGRLDGRVEIVDVAPTLAAILGIAAPSSSEGRVLPIPP